MDVFLAFFWTKGKAEELLGLSQVPLAAMQNEEGKKNSKRESEKERGVKSWTWGLFDIGGMREQEWGSVIQHTLWEHGQDSSSV